jgi:hypothetical protein
MTPTPEALPDQFEPNDTPGQAYPCLLDQPVALTLHSPADEDWCVFTSQAGVWYVIETSQLSPEIDTLLSLFAADGTTLLAEDDNGGGGAASRILRALPNGSHYVRVRGVGAGRLSPRVANTSLGGYTLGFRGATAPHSAFLPVAQRPGP